MVVINASSNFGTVAFGEPETVELSFPGDSRRKVTATCVHGAWRPAERLTRFLPEDFSISIDSYAGPDGLRRIVPRRPRRNFEESIDVGAVGGLAVLHGLRGFNTEFDYTYRAMLLIHQHVRGRVYRGARGMREHLSRDFKYSRDLSIQPLGRFTDDEQDVLPDDVGLNAQREGHQLSVTQLTESGRRAAREACYRNPTSKNAIAFGLYEAARLNPLEVEPQKVPALVRMALFDIDPSKGVPSEELVDIVTERLLEAIGPHLDDSREEFDRWFSGPSNSLVKQIAQQQHRRGGRLRREDVRQALLHLGWRAYEYVGQCIHTMMRTIKNSMPEPLNDEERRIFEQMHERQPHYGNLPLALLAERTSFLRRSVLAVWDEPDNQDNVHVLHRLMWYYSDMACKRREADRQSKQRSQCDPPISLEEVCAVDQAMQEDGDPKTEGKDPEDRGHTSCTRYGGSVQLIDNLHCPLPAEENPFLQVAEHIRQLHEIECDAACEQWEYHREGESEESVTVGMRCECGHIAQTIEMPIDEFAERAEEVLQWGRSAPAHRATGAGEPSGES